MPIFAYPRVAASLEPAVSLTAGDEWTEVSTPDARLAISYFVGEGVFSPNIALLINRHGPGYPAPAVIAALEQVAAGLDDAKLEDPFDVSLGDRTFAGRILVYRHADAGTLAELHLATAVDRPDDTDIVHLVGTCAGDRVTDDLPMLRDVLSTVRIADPVNEQT